MKKRGLKWISVFLGGAVSLSEQASGQNELKVGKTVSSTGDMMNLRVEGSSELESSLSLSLLFVMGIGFVNCIFRY